MAQAFLGLFDEPEGAAQALERLRRSGFPDTDVEVLTSCPYPDGAFGEPKSKHHLYVFPFVGGACGLLVGVLLVVGTQLYYPLVTGGKPILSIPPMLNILFEATMLGAIIFSFAGFLFEARLTGLGDIPYDRRIGEGAIGVAVRRAGSREGDVRRALMASGAVDIVGGSPGED
jgi:hypothetical protein